MEPQDNKQLAIRKAISAHQEAANALADLTSDVLNPGPDALLERVKQNLADLHAMAQRSDPADTV